MFQFRVLAVEDGFWKKKNLILELIKRFTSINAGKFYLAEPWYTSCSNLTGYTLLDILFPSFFATALVYEDTNV